MDAANPWGCNQYGHRKGHKGGERKKNESDDVYDFDNMEPDERLQRAIDELGEVEEEDIDWDDYDKAQEVKKIFHPDNHKVAQWRKERMINEVGNRVTDALNNLAKVNKARRDFRNPNRPTEDDVTRAEEAFGKAVHEWRRFHRARLEVQGWDKKAIDGYLSRWPEYMETANEEDIDAANPYGCNQYGEGWKAPHNGRASKAGAPVKKSDEVKEELPNLIGSAKQVEWAESIREDAIRQVSGIMSDPERKSLMSRIRTAKWWIDHRNDAMTLELLKEAVAEDEKAVEEEHEEIERRKERDRNWRNYQEKVRRGIIKPYDPDGKLRRATDYLYSARTEESEAIEAQCNQYEHVPGCPNTNGVIPKNKKKRKNRKIGHIDKKRVTKIGTFPKLAQFGIKQGEVSITGNGVKKGIINKRWTENNYVSKLALSLQEARFARIEPNKKHPTKQVVLVFCVMQYDGITHYNKVVIDQKTGKVNSMHDIGKAAFIKEKGQSIR